MDDDFLDDLLADVGSDLQSTVLQSTASAWDPPSSAMAESSSAVSAPASGITTVDSLQFAAPRRATFLVLPSATGRSKSAVHPDMGLYRLCELWRQLGITKKRDPENTAAAVEARLSLSLADSLSIATAPRGRGGGSGGGAGPQLKRFAVPGTGRIAFAPSKAELPPVFLSEMASGVVSGTKKVQPLPQQQQKQQEQQESASSRGIEAARLKMAEWQEEWASDEELPNDHLSGAGSGVVSGGGLDAALMPLGKQLQREAAMAQSRIHKVATAKSKSKKFG